MSTVTSGSFVPSADDGNLGARGFIARLNTASNAAGLATPAGAYSGATVYNRSPSQWLRATLTFVAGFVPNAVTDIFQLIPANGSASWAFDSDVISQITVQVITLPAAGTIEPADTLTVAAAVTGTVDVTINVVNG